MVGNRLKDLRESRGWSFQEVADKLHIAKSTYAGYEYDRRDVPNELLPRVAQLYNVTTDYLLGLSNHPQQTQEENKKYSEEKYLKVIEDFKNGRVAGYPPEVQTMIASAMERQLEEYKKQSEDQMDEEEKDDDDDRDDQDSEHEDQDSEQT
ncbi:helix-turn-helix domain-containing protein [Tumebacillus flagellatus]|uniref:HTH cro/C1-type domain-containing protein n=1 Tax=Tumebacillus flagellatus TaxID=1157490 RepID=A0A074LK38_9BACL|nr:helix-turn-helix transcriptional regulator [Tumebacillus flagellatus]KEO80970.1 hypothetical protein EL26_23385 [Tumebacillus flagellatus]